MLSTKVNNSQKILVAPEIKFTKSKANADAVNPDAKARLVGSRF